MEFLIIFGIVGFFMALNTRNKVSRLEAELKRKGLVDDVSVEIGGWHQSKTSLLVLILSAAVILAVFIGSIFMRS
jgi:hypothetical protein